MLQSLHDLYRQCYLRKQVEHLLMLFKSLTDQMDIYLGLSTGGHSMEQRNALLQKRELYLIKCLQLRCIEWFDILKMRFSTMIQAPHFTLIGLQKATLHQGIQRLERCMTGIHQFVTCNLDNRLPTFGALQRVPVRKGEIVDKGSQLAVGSMKHIKCRMECVLIPELWSQADIQFRLRLVTVFGFQS